MEMDQSSEESEISESDIPDYEEKLYRRLQQGHYKVRNTNGSSRCPFCAGKKKQDYAYHELLQHATEIGASNRNVNVKAKHCALAKYLNKDMVDHAASSQAVNPGPVGDHLRKNGDLKTVDDLSNEESHKTSRLVANLASQIEVKNKHLEELQCKCNETTLSLDKMMEERDSLVHTYNEEIKKMQLLARDHSQYATALYPHEEA